METHRENGPLGGCSFAFVWGREKRGGECKTCGWRESEEAGRERGFTSQMETSLALRLRTSSSREKIRKSLMNERQEKIITLALRCVSSRQASPSNRRHSWKLVNSSTESGHHPACRNTVPKVSAQLHTGSIHQTLSVASLLSVLSPPPLSLIIIFPQWNGVVTLVWEVHESSCIPWPNSKEFVLSHESYL